MIPFHYKGQPVQFDTDGWLHATAIAARFEKEPYGWLVSVDTISCMIALADGLGIKVKPVTLQEFSKIRELDASKASTKSRLLRLAKDVGLVRTKAGSPQFGGGTWLHPKLAVVFARWLDIGFAVWCDLHIDALLRGELTEKQQFDKACQELSEGRAKASLHGMCLARWKGEKPRLEHRVDELRDRLQLVLGLDQAALGESRRPVTAR